MFQGVFVRSQVGQKLMAIKRFCQRLYCYIGQWGQGLSKGNIEVNRTRLGRSRLLPGELHSLAEIIQGRLSCIRQPKLSLPVGIVTKELHLINCLPRVAVTQLWRAISREDQ